MRSTTMCRHFLLGCLAFLLHFAQAQIMSVDMGHEFFKVALMRQGAPLEIVLNAHSKRKTPTAVSFFEAIRAFGDDALAHAGKAPTKVPTFFHSLMGRNFTTADAVQPGGEWWKAFGLNEQFYTYNLDYDASRGVPVFKIGDVDMSNEKVLANILFYCQKLSQISADGKPVKDTVVTVSADANLRMRQAVVAAGEIAGLRVVSLVHEGSAFAVQRAVDFAPEKGNVERTLFYNLGSRKAEVTIVAFESRQAGMVAGKTAPVVTVLSSVSDFNIGGHLMDLKIADVMLKKFQEKNKKLADGIVKNPRALRKLISQAQKTKAMLSANKNAPFIVESLFEDTDFQASIKREEFEAMCKDMLERLTDPVTAALASANLTMQDINSVEVVGGAWRVPKVQQTLSEFFEKSAGKKLPLGQHLNGEEAAATGAALVGANASTSFRVKKIFFTDITLHAYAVQVVSLTGAWEKNLTTLYPVGAPLGGKKKLSFNLEEDFAIKLFEDGILVATYTISGLTDKLTNGTWKEYNMTGPPKLTVNVNLEGSGIIEVKNPLATVEEAYWVNATKEKPKPNATANGTNGTNDTETSESNATNGSEDPNASNATVELEVYQKLKKKKHEKKLTVTRVDYFPVPMEEEAIEAAKKELSELAAKEEEVMAVNQVKNELEAAIYGSREKVESDTIMKVSTEEQREEVTKYCTEYEEWMYEGGTSKTDYESRLTKLKDLLGPMEERALEMEHREDLPEKVTENIELIKNVQALIKKNMSWVTENKTEPALSKLKEFEEWWKKKQDSQASLPLHEAPAYTKAEVMEKLGKVAKEWEKLRKMKKPKEPKPPKAKKNATNATDTKKDAKASKKEKEKEAELPADLEKAEAELANVREKKTSAVENEDFDMAHKLKQREKTLTEHIKKLKEEKSEL